MVVVAITATRSILKKSLMEILGHHSGIMESYVVTLKR
jgi:hypothetical protein